LNGNGNGNYFWRGPKLSVYGEKKMSKICMISASGLRKFCSFGFLGVLLLVSGCGVGGFSSPTVTTSTSQLDATNSTFNSQTGTITVTPQDLTVTDNNGKTVMTIKNGTTITGFVNGTQTAFPNLPVTIVVSEPVSGVEGMPQPITTGYTIASTAGAVEISIGSMSTVNFFLGEIPLL
jgi:hypothetical protein